MRERAAKLAGLGQYRDGRGTGARVARELRVTVEVAAGEPARGRRAQLQLRDDVEPVERQRWRRGPRQRAPLQGGLALGGACRANALAACGSHALEERHGATPFANELIAASSFAAAPLSKVARARATARRASGSRPVTSSASAAPSTSASRCAAE